MKRFLGLLLAVPTLYRRWWFVNRAKLMARLMRVDLDISVDRRVKFGRNVKLKLDPGNPIKIHIGPNVEFEDDVRIEIRNGVGYDPTLIIAGNSIFHTRVVMIISGKPWFKGLNEIGIGTVIRCTQYIEWGSPSGSGEYVSVYDFFHCIDENLEFSYQDTQIRQPVKFANWVMLGAKSTVNPGVTLAGANLVAPNSVVSGVHNTPSQLMAGIPAKPLNKPEMLPVLQNPFIAALTSWLDDRPGPAYKTVEEAVASTPDPVQWEQSKYGWDATLRRIQEELQAAAKDTEKEAGRDAAKDNGTQAKVDTKAD